METLLCMMIDLWVIRNKVVHGKEYQQQQQQQKERKKERASVKVRAFNNKQEEKRANDAFLFYNDVDERN